MLALMVEKQTLLSRLACVSWDSNGKTQVRPALIGDIREYEEAKASRRTAMRQSIAKQSKE